MSMISVEQALHSVENNIVPTISSELRKASEATGFTLFEDFFSPINMPPFRQSAMDGYALYLHDDLSYKIIGEVKAGDHYHPNLKKGEAVRIFTGAPVPDSANAVIMQEKTRVENNVITIASQVSNNENIRPLGEQVLKDQLALKKGTLLTPAAIAFISALGVANIKVYSKPSIVIVVTGNELAEAGSVLAHGQIYESNAVMLASALKGLGYENVSTYKVDDNYKNTVDLLDKVIANHDVILVSGGISVGDYDFVGKALQELEVKEVFYKVNQKPGKPLFFGKKEDKLVFALPGNPAAALSCFYIYVLSALQKMSGNMNFSLTKIKAQSQSDFVKKGGRAQFLKAIYKHGKVEILEGQNSSMLHTFALANALVYLQETANSIQKNDAVEVILLPIH
jgi:molybdopterin molybdotransferase